MKRSNGDPQEEFKVAGKLLFEQSEKRKAEALAKIEQERTKKDLEELEERRQEDALREKEAEKERQKGLKEEERKKKDEKENRPRVQAAIKRKEELEIEKRELQAQRALKPDQRQHLIDSLKRPVFFYEEQGLPDHCAWATGELVHTFESAIKELEIKGFDKLGCTWASITKSGMLECGPCKKIRESVECPDSQWPIPSYYDGIEIRPFPIPPPTSFWTEQPQSTRWGARSEDSLFEGALSNYQGSVSHHPWLGYYPIDYLTRCLGHQEPAVVEDQVFAVFASALKDLGSSEAILQANLSIERLGLFDGDIFYPDFVGEPERVLDGWTKFNESIVDEGDDPILSDCLRDSEDNLPISDPRHRWLRLISDSKTRSQFRREIQELLLECFMAGREFERVLLGEKSKEESSKFSKLKEKGLRSIKVEEREKTFEKIVNLVLEQKGGLDGIGPAGIVKFLEREGHEDLVEFLRVVPKNALKNYLQSKKRNSE